MISLMIGGSQILVLVLVIKIVSIIFCVKRAEKLNRNKIGWGIFALIADIIAVIALLFMKPKK